MDTRKLMRDSLKNIDRAACATYLKMSLGSLNNQVAGELPYRPKGTSSNLLDKAWDFIDYCHCETGSVLILEKFAEELGCFVVKNPEIRCTELPALEGISRMIRQFADVIDEIACVNADGVISVHEAAGIRAKWEILKRVAEEFVITAEVGKYDKQGE